MSWAIVHGDTITPVTGAFDALVEELDHEGKPSMGRTHFPAGHLDGLDDAGRAALGAFPMIDAPPGLGPGETYTGTHALQFTGSQVLRIAGKRTLTDDELRSAAIATAVSVYTDRLGVGFPIPGGGGDTLQLRNETDRTNWLTLMGACDDAISGGAGAEPCALPIRTTANASLALTWAETKALLVALRGWGAAMQANHWAHKDAVAAASRAELLAGFDFSTGWPT